ncbi:MAG: ABC transporter ATP-binding protein [Bifidobacteriaceae bacterium]|nr:ABC transporter ATP-binding protein [Bifidobacteriaceae bacterium]
MTAAIEVKDLVKRYRRTAALDGVSLRFEDGVTHGLFGHNGAGKTTLLSIVGAQARATSGQVKVFGLAPYENAAALARLCFIREGQIYPNDARPADLFKVARLFHPRWDQGLANHLIEALAIPMDRRVRRLSRGQNSAVGVTIGLAARADVTFFDEPYLGLDAMARHVFYEALREVQEHDPHAVLLSSHLIDEVASLVENVVVLDRGRVFIDQPRDELLSRAARIIGPAEAAERFAGGREVIAREALGPYLALTVLGPLSDADQSALAAASLTSETVSLQQLVVHLTRAAALDRGAGTTGRAASGPSARTASGAGKAMGAGTGDRLDGGAA